MNSAQAGPRPLQPRHKVQYKTVEVHTLYDIKKIINELQRKPEAKTIKTTIQSNDGNGKLVKYDVEAPIGVDYHTMLFEGFTQMKNRAEAIEKGGPRAVKALNIGGHHWLDDLVTRRFGGQRDGLRIKWVVSEGTFYFDPLGNKLTQAI